jgi:N4-(beta-N-acetylglucosaminyl)-L-asparaginase
MMFALIATWEFSLAGVTNAAGLLRGGGDAESAAEVIAKMVEDDPAVDTVGFGAWPNLEGKMELDAAMMRGRDLALGAVLGIRGFKNPVTVARLVMNRCSHNVLCSGGAEDFAGRNGCTRAEMLSEEARLRWLKRVEERRTEPDGHDTVGALALDSHGDIVAATSTSGLAMKLPGRIGDSPLVGSGFYADNDVGAAAATGVGEDIMRCCLSYTAVELMRGGMSPRQAAERAVLRAHRSLMRFGPVGNMAIVCLDRHGQVGGAANHDGFSYAAAAEGFEPQLVAVQKII